MFTKGRIKRLSGSLAIALLGACSFQLQTLSQFVQLPYPSTTFYVSCADTIIRADGTRVRTGANANNLMDGKSWETAWTDCDQIVWSKVRPSDVIEIDGGKDAQHQLQYIHSLKVGADGFPGYPIKIISSKAPGRNGRVVLDGSRLKEKVGIDVGSHKYIYVEGQARSSNTGFSDALQNAEKTILVRYFSQSGISTTNGTQVLLQDIEVSQNGIYPSIQSGGSGLNLTNSTYIYCDNMIVRNNATQVIINNLVTPASSANISLYGCWIYNDPVLAYQSRNLVNYSDGIVVRGNGQRMTTFVYQSVLGPGLAVGLDDATPSGHPQLLQCLLLNPKVTNIRAANESGASIGLCTSYLTPLNVESKGHSCISLGAPSSKLAANSIYQSIFWGGVVEAQNVRPSGNFQYKTSGNTTAISATQIDPLFQAPLSAFDQILTSSPGSATSLLLSADFSLKPNSPATVSRGITSVQQLLLTRRHFSGL